MSKYRYRRRKSARDVETRAERKALWMRVKNGFRNKLCSNGVYYCDHIYEEEHPWQWVDFRFLSERHHRRYFAVAASCLRYQAYGMAEDLAHAEADKDWPLPEDGCYFGPGFKDPVYGKLYELKTTDEYRVQYNHWKTAYDEYLRHFLQKPVVLRPTIEVRLEYGPVAVGIWATLNRSHLDADALMEFIQQFRELGEPLRQGIVWQGEEVTVVPAEIYEGA